MPTHTKNYYRFLEANKDLPLRMDRVDIIINEYPSGALEARLIIMNNTRARDLRAAEPLLLQWRDRILDWKGPYPYFAGLKFFQDLDEKHNKGYSYKRIAEEANLNLLELMKAYYVFADNVMRVSSNFKTKGDYRNWIIKSWLAIDDKKEKERRFNQAIAAKIAINQMYQFRMNDSEIREYVRYSLEDIKIGAERLLPDYPISREQVIYIMREWKRIKTKINQAEVSREYWDNLHLDYPAGDDVFYLMKRENALSLQRKEAGHWDDNMIWDPLLLHDPEQGMLFL